MKNQILLLLVFVSVFSFGQAPVSYITFNKDTIQLYAYEGSHIVLLPRKNNLNPVTIQKLISVFDSVYEFYASVTGQEPVLFRNINGKTTIADVPSTCGAGCGYLGLTGIELQNHYFDILYDSVDQHNTFDQPLFYENGRNFWFYGNKIDFTGGGSVTTGYAVYMRFKAMDYSHVNPAYFGTTPFPVFRNAVKSLIDIYMQDTTNNWTNTIGVGHVPANPLNLGATDLFASFLMRLEENYGQDSFVNRIWKEVGNRPIGVTKQDAEDNFILASCAAAKCNLIPQFKIWRWTVSTLAENYASSHYSDCSASTSIDLIDPIQINLYPIPATSSLMLESKVSIKNIQILNVLGEVISEEYAIHAYTKEVDLTAFADGPYIINIDTENGQVIKRIIKLNN